MDPATIMALTSLASGAGSYLANRGNAPKETSNQRKQGHLIDKLMGSLNGKGEYGDLFKFDQDTFQKSFIDPAKARFNNQIAPMIQQKYAATGQVRGGGLQNELTQAGVDLDSMLNQYMFQAQEGAKGRQQSAIGQILGAGAGAPNEQTGGQAFLSGVGGGLSSDAFAQQLAKYGQPSTAASPAKTTAVFASNQLRPGFKPPQIPIGQQGWQ